MTAVVLSPVGIGTQWLNSSGLVLSGGKINTYIAGTTTPIPTYTDATGSVLNANPIILDSTGRYSNEIWWAVGSHVKLVITDSFGVIQFNLDNLTGLNDISAISFPINRSTFTATAGQTVFTIPSYAPGTNALSVYVNGAHKASGTEYTETSTTTITFAFQVLVGSDVDIYYSVPNSLGSLSATNVGYTPPGTGTVATTVASKFGQFLTSVKDFGAVGNGIADDTAAIQLAINYAQGGVTGLWFPAGTYLVSSTLTITGSLSIFGAARYACYITWTSPTLNVINFNSDTAFTVENMFFLGPSTPTAGSVITLTGPTGSGNLLSFIRDCDFQNSWIAFNTGSAAQWSISGCFFGNYQSIGVQIQDTLNPDAGDSEISDCQFFNALMTIGTGILQLSSGGLRLISNKFNGGVIAYQLQLPSSGALTSDLLIIGNSFEDGFTGELLFTRPFGGAENFTNVIITGNQFSPISPFSTAWTAINTDNNIPLFKITISGNQINLPISTGNPTFTGINLGSNVNSFVIDGNEIYANAGSGSPVNYGITIAAAVTGGLIGVNRFDGSPWTLKIGNNAGAAVQVIPNSVVKGTTGTFNTNTVFGNIFSGSIAITFATAFDSAPIVTCSPEGLSAAISAFPSGITSSGFTLNALSATSQTNQTAKWVAQGIV